MKNNKGQSATILTSLIFGIGFLVMTLILVFVIVDTVTNANLLTGGRETITVTNESDNNGALAYINQTGYALSRVNASNSAYTITRIWADWNQSNGSQSAIVNTSTGYNITVATANFSLQANGTLINATNYVFPNVSVSYTFQTLGLDELATNQVTGNFSTGVQNDLAPKIRTAVSVAAIILILSILSILIVVYRRINLDSSL